MTCDAIYMITMGLNIIPFVIALVSLRVESYEGVKRLLSVFVGSVILFGGLFIITLLCLRC